MRQYQTVAEMRRALDASRKAAEAVQDVPAPGVRRKLIKPGLLLDEDDLLPLLEAIEKREIYIRRVKEAGKKSRDINVLLTAIEEKV